MSPSPRTSPFGSGSRNGGHQSRGCGADLRDELSRPLFSISTCDLPAGRLRPCPSWARPWLPYGFFFCGYPGRTTRPDTPEEAKSPGSIAPRAFRLIRSREQPAHDTADRASRFPFLKGHRPPRSPRGARHSSRTASRRPRRGPS